MKMLPLGAVSSIPDKRTDRQGDATKLTVAFLNYASASKTLYGVFICVCKIQTNCDFVNGKACLIYIYIYAE